MWKTALARATAAAVAASSPRKSSGSNDRRSWTGMWLMKAAGMAVKIRILIQPLNIAPGYTEKVMTAWNAWKAAASALPMKNASEPAITMNAANTSALQHTSTTYSATNHTS